MRRLAFLGIMALAGCSNPEFRDFFGLPSGSAPVAAADTPVVPTSVTAPPPRPEARTADEFDTTSAEERAAAVTAPQPAGERRLGTTIASLGSPADPGIWMLTGLVSDVVMGRVVHGPSGASVNLELRPSGGSPEAGSQISLPALRLLNLPLTSLPELTVFAP